MVQRMVRRVVDDRLERVSGDHVRVVDEDGPAVDDHEEAEVQLTVEGKEVDEEVVRDGLGVSVERVERVRREGRRDCEGGMSVFSAECGTRVVTHSATCGGACAATCSRWGGAPSGESSRCNSR